MANSVNLPAPYLGVNQKLPVAALQSPYCETLFNFNTNEQGISLRYGDEIVSASSGYSSVSALAAYGDSLLILVATADSGTSTKFINAESGAILHSVSTTGSENYYPVYFSNRLYFFNNETNSPGYVYDGSTWAAIGYTAASGTFTPANAAVYKSRMYIADLLTGGYWYTTIGGVTGTVTHVDLQTIANQKGIVTTITPITIADNVSAVDLLAIVFDTGEVLFYSGSYPDSSDWALVGRAQIGKPIDNNSGVTYQGDFLVFTYSGVVSLRDLFLKGASNAAFLSVNSQINETWIKLFNGGETVRATGIWEASSNRIIIAASGYLDEDGVIQDGAFYFVFDCIRQSWMFHRSFGIDDSVNLILIANFGGYAYVAARCATIALGSYASVWVKEGADGFTDRKFSDTAEVPYDYEMLSAPIPFPKTAVYEATLIEPIIESDLYAQTNWNFVVDFGRQTSGDQTTDAATTNVAKPAVNVGMQNITYVQVKMSGTTVEDKTVGLTLYSYNVLYNAGAEGSR